MKTEPPTRIPIPLRLRWRNASSHFLPVTVLAGALVVIPMLWKDQINVTGIRNTSRKGYRSLRVVGQHPA
jgi:hypothetical protein